MTMAHDFVPNSDKLKTHLTTSGVSLPASGAYQAHHVIPGSATKNQNKV